MDWQFYHYGPYAVELENSINDNAFVRVFGGRQTGYGFSVSREWREIQRSFNAEYDGATKRTVERVVEQWALEPLETILDYVYFETEPMQNVERGQLLDFSTVVRFGETTDRAVSLNYPDGFLAELRTQWDRRKRTSIGSLEVPQDEITEEAFQIMAEEERASFDIPRRIHLRGPERGNSS